MRGFAKLLALAALLLALGVSRARGGSEIGSSSVYTKALSTTTATATTYALLGDATATAGAGADITFIIEAKNATQVCTITGRVLVAAQNDAGTVTAVSTTFTSGSTGAISSVVPFTGFTTTTTVTVTGTNVNLRVTPSWSAGTPTSVTLTYTVQLLGTAATLTPQ